MNAHNTSPRASTPMTMSLHRQVLDDLPLMETVEFRRFIKARKELLDDIEPL